jgi:hypothetical protein
LAVLLVLAPSTPAIAATFADERFAAIASMSDTPALDVQAITIDEGEGESIAFVLAFSAAFEPPGEGYRIAVSVGDPTAKRTRWTLTIVDGASVGTVETGDGVQWDAVGGTAAQLDPQAGRAVIEAGPTDVTPASALWVDAELPTPLGSIVSTSSYFSYEALVAAPSTTDLGGTAWGWTRDAEGVRVDGAVRIAGRPPTAAIVDGVLVLAALDAPPSLLYGQPVTSAADYVRFASADVPPDDGGYLVVNRVDGVVQLFSVSGGTATEVVGAAARIVPAPGRAAEAGDASAPPGTRTVAVDLAEVLRELDLPADPAGVALAVERGSGLANGWVVTASGVSATVASLAAASAAGSESGTETSSAPDLVLEADEGSDSSLAVLLVIAAVLAVVVIAGVVAAIVVGRERRKRHETLMAEGWYEPAADLDDTAHWTSALAAPVHGDLGTDDDLGTERDLGTNGDSPPGAQEASEAAVETEAAVDTDTEPSIDVSDARASQDRALEALEAQFADLFERADQLDSKRD